MSLNYDLYLFKCNAEAICEAVVCAKCKRRIHVKIKIYSSGVITYNFVDMCCPEHEANLRSFMIDNHQEICQAHSIDNLENLVALWRAQHE